jgi:hypothetical protein
LAEATGNPLALVELSIAWGAEQDSDAPRTPWLPLTDRLEVAFADRLSSLSSATRRLLHVAALDASGNLAEVLSAASNLEGREVTLESVSEAEAARLIETDGSHLRFRHPLIRSAIHRAMSLDQRQATHAALAAILEGDPDRGVWHRAAAAYGRSEEIAAAINEQTNRTLFILTVITVLALPISMVAGLFGMNVGGIPFAGEAFLGYVALRSRRD